MKNFGIFISLILFAIVGIVLGIVDNPGHSFQYSSPWLAASFVISALNKN